MASLPPDYGSDQCQGGASCDNRSVQYHRAPRLFEALALARDDGRYGRLLKTLGRIQLLILDDWGLSVLNPPERSDLLEILDDRHGLASLPRVSTNAGHPLVQ